MCEPIPASIVKAICKVQAGIGAIKKDTKNQHGGYMFASTDSIYAEITRKMAEAGLVVVSLEDKPPEIARVEKDGKTSQWLNVSYSFILATEDATWTDRALTRTLFIQVTGPQTFMSAQSYVEKSFFRSLFKIPTGDMDLDSVAQAETEEAQLALTGNGARRKSSAAAKRDGGMGKFDAIRKAIVDARSPEELESVPETHSDAWGELPQRWEEMISDEYKLRMEQLRS